MAHERLQDRDWSQRPSYRLYASVHGRDYVRFSFSVEGFL